LGAYFRQIGGDFLENNPGLVLWLGLWPEKRNFQLKILVSFIFLVAKVALAWNPPFRRYSRSRTPVGWMAMVKKTDDCKTLNSETHTKADVFI
jgi:hypothetical protein